MKLIKIISFVLICLCSMNAKAWNLDVDHSSVSFVTIKKNNTAETHLFTDISGQLVGSTAQVIIKPDSVDTKIAIRDQRIRDFLFETKLYPTIKISSDVGELVTNLTAGESVLMSMPAQLELHGMIQSVTLDVRVTLLSDQQLLVSSVKPVVIRAVDFNMLAGIKMLAGFVNDLVIAESVPVMFDLSFIKPLAQSEVN